jgi:hypothetical protein
MQPIQNVQEIAQIVEPTKQEYMVPQFILSQIYASPVEGYTNGKAAMTAWGTERIVGSQEPDAHGQGWLRIKVNAGKFFRGWIRICLSASGLYTLKFESVDNRSSEVSPQRNIERVPGEKVASAIDVILFGPLTEENPAG